MFKVNSMLLDLNGILFLLQLFFMIGLGVYADYGGWRFWLLLGGFESFLNDLILFIGPNSILILSMIALSSIRESSGWDVGASRLYDRMSRWVIHLNPEMHSS